MKSCILKNQLVVTIIGTIGILSACSTTKPIVPDQKNVKVSREAAHEGCNSLGSVEGRVLTKSGTIEQAIEDMKLDAARKGANYVQMETASAYGTTTRGEAFDCP